MEQWEVPLSGTLRITNIKTLEKWIQNGQYQQELDDGYIYAPGCGRFTRKLCTCSKCRRGKGEDRKQLINNLKSNLK